jgi:hypothetical protein
MPFDPDAYLAKKKGVAPAAPAAGGFDPDAYLAKKGVTTAPAAPAPAGYKVDDPFKMSADELLQKGKGYMDAGPRLMKGPGFDIPIVTPLAERITGTQEESQMQREKLQREDPDAAMVKGLLGQIPVPGMKQIPGGFFANAAGNTAYNAGTVYADQRLHGKGNEEALDDAETAGTWTAALAGGGGLLGLAGKGYSRFMAGIRPKTLEKYRARRSEINELSEEAAQDQLGDAAGSIREKSRTIKEETNGLVSDLKDQAKGEARIREEQAMEGVKQNREKGFREADEMQRGVAENLSFAQKGARKAVNESAYEAMRIAEESGTNIKLAPFKASLTARLNELKVGDKPMGGGVEVLTKLRQSLDEIGKKEISAVEFRRLIKSLDDDISDIMGKTAKAGYITPAERTLSNVRKGWSEALKTKVPGYREQMAKTAGKTESLNTMRDQFSFEPDDIYRELNGIDDVSRMGRRESLQQFQDEFGGDYLQKMDEVKGKRNYDYDADAKPELQRAEEMRSQKFRDYFKDKYDEAARLKHVARGITPDNAQSTMRRFGNNPEKNITLGRRLEDIANEMGIDPKTFVQMADDLAVKRAMEGSFTHGSRNVNQTAFSMQGLAHMMGAGENAGMIAKGFGAVIGGASDLMGPTLVKKVVDVLDSPGGKRFHTFFSEAAKRGPRAVALTHELLMKNDEDYRQAVGGP